MPHSVHTAHAPHVVARWTLRRPNGVVAGTTAAHSGGAPRYNRDTAEIHTFKGDDAGTTGARGGGDAPSAASYQLFFHDGSKTLTIDGMHSSDDVGASATHTQSTDPSACGAHTACCISTVSRLHLGCISGHLSYISVASRVSVGR